MNRVRVVAIAILTMFALAVVAQEAHHGAAHGSMPSADQHLKMLTEQLNLTPDQQAKAKPIIQQMTDGAQKAMQDESLSQQERKQKAHAAMQAADKKFREILTDEQKTKLDEMEAQMRGDHAKPQQ